MSADIKFVGGNAELVHKIWRM